MTYTCPVCQSIVEGDLVKYIDHTEKHIVDEIRKAKPELQDGDGVCVKCYEYFKNQIRGD